jgi:hypothetical protein
VPSGVLKAIDMHQGKQNAKPKRKRRSEPVLEGRTSPRANREIRDLRKNINSSGAEDRLVAND